MNLNISLGLGSQYSRAGGGGDSEPRPYILCADVPTCVDVWACDTVIEGSDAFFVDYGLYDDLGGLLTDDSGDGLWSVD